MGNSIPDRIATAVAALPLAPGMRVLEIGCGPGVAARAVAARIGDGLVVAIDRSEKAVALAVRGSGPEIAAGRLEFRQSAIEDFTLRDGEPRFDLAFAHRVGALDGRHPAAGKQALQRLKLALKPDGLLVIDDRPAIVARDIDG
jgi:SAM-dependent methyltransferase